MVKVIEKNHKRIDYPANKHRSCSAAKGRQQTSMIEVFSSDVLGI